ncbi:hypothetical protein SAMN05444320_11289 [Streptoalloteichus hindustanus]|uniref:Uncharacterized protein n=1 Tax=Streptoalloteichus hindustanus TaxID=2017 RepID=A0A1M5LWR3_STRHI|nr:hypothetical protein SAMN05444320_11289 [Streptoalloteichus hindustanus]
MWTTRLTKVWIYHQGGAFKLSSVDRTELGSVADGTRSGPHPDDVN